MSDTSPVPPEAQEVQVLRLHESRIIFPDTPEMHRQFQGVADILEERRRQDEKWGEQNHNLNIFMSILTEEVGEAAKEINDGTFRQARSLATRGTESDSHAEAQGKHARKLRTEMVQVAAVALSILEYLDRNDGGSFL